MILFREEKGFFKGRFLKAFQLFKIFLIHVFNFLPQVYKRWREWCNDQIIAEEIAAFWDEYQRLS